MLVYSKVKKLIWSVPTRSTATTMAASSPSEGDHFYYFAFGSNLLRERVSINSPSAVFVTTAKLEGVWVTLIYVLFFFPVTHSLVSNLNIFFPAPEKKIHCFYSLTRFGNKSDLFQK